MSQPARVDDGLRELTKEVLEGGIVVRKVYFPLPDPRFEQATAPMCPYYLVTLTLAVPVEVWSTSWRKAGQPVTPAPNKTLKYHVEATVKPVAQNQWRVAPEGPWVPDGLVSTHPTPELALEACVAYLRRWDAARMLTGDIPAFPEQE
jgi:hypothetical protein